MQFPRGNGPLVSVLIPTRGRPRWLCEAIDSVYSLAYDKSLLEFIVKIDDDDQETIKVAKAISHLIPLKAIISPRGNGYHDMHLWVNDMCRMASGDWLFLFNDDARILTQYWDVALLNYDPPDQALQRPEVCLLVARTVTRPDAYEFIMLRHEAFKVLGHFSLNPHNDNWIFSVAAMIRSAILAPIEIHHFSEHAEDATREESQAAYATTSPLLMTSPMIRAMIADALKLQDYIDSLRQAEQVSEGQSDPLPPSAVSKTL